MREPTIPFPPAERRNTSHLLSVDDFIKKSSIVYYTKEGLKEARGDIGLLADNEGLEAHKKAVDLRFEKDEEQPD